MTRDAASGRDSNLHRRLTVRHGILRDTHDLNGVRWGTGLRELVMDVYRSCGAKLGKDRDRVRDFADNRLKRNTVDDLGAALSLIAATPALAPTVGAKLEQGLIRLVRSLFVRHAGTVQSTAEDEADAQADADKATMRVVIDLERRGDLAAMRRGIEANIAHQCRLGDLIAAMQAAEVRMMVRNNSGAARRFVLGRPS
jgi:hypothetical protein